MDRTDETRKTTNMRSVILKLSRSVRTQRSGTRWRWRIPLVLTWCELRGWRLLCSFNGDLCACSTWLQRVRRVQPESNRRLWSTRSWPWLKKLVEFSQPSQLLISTRRVTVVRKWLSHGEKYYHSFCKILNFLKAILGFEKFSCQFLWMCRTNICIIRC